MPFGRELVLRGAEERLAPILMTALATGLALVPIVDRRQPIRAGSRTSDGRRHPRRAVHVDGAEPVPAAGALPAIRWEGRHGEIAHGPRWVRLRRSVDPRNELTAALAPIVYDQARTAPFELIQRHRDHLRIELRVVEERQLAEPTEFALMTGIAAREPIRYSDTHKPLAAPSVEDHCVKGSQRMRGSRRLRRIVQLPLRHVDERHLIREPRPDPSKLRVSGRR